MTPKEYLQQYINLDHEIDRLLDERQHWIDLATKITPTYSDAPGGGSEGGGKVPNAVEKIVEWGQKIDTKVDELVELRKEIGERIERIADGRQREVLTRRYIHGQKWEQIAVDMNYSYMQVCRIHGQALQAMML